MSKKFKRVEESNHFSHYESNYTPVNLRDLEVFVNSNLRIVGIFPMENDQLSVVVQRADQTQTPSTLLVP